LNILLKAFLFAGRAFGFINVENKYIPSTAFIPILHLHKTTTGALKHYNKNTTQITPIGVKH
jgi:hypothetical protein